MLKDFDSQPRAVRADGTFEVTGLQAVGFSLRPVSGKAVFPVKVVVDDDNAHPITVDSPDYFSQPNVFNKIQVDTTPGGGLEGDMWDVKVRPTEYDEGRVRLLRDKQGNLRVAPSGLTTLFSLNSTGATMDDGAGAFFESPGYFNLATSPLLRLYLNPAPAKRWGVSFSNSPGKAWDISRFRQVRYSLRQTIAYKHASHLKLIITFHEREDDPSWLLSATAANNHVPPFVGAGTINNFGDDGVPGVNERDSGFILLGGGAESVSDYSTVTPVTAPFARFCIDVGGGYFPRSSGGVVEQMLLSAQGWW